ncbi:hypothetical protein PAPYR_10557 [Paratrimastix pyriformis]|uniref:Uncharacterized protein n=1 Tax=Paratrimastix pyriformis TaxID=342808 RepID=A0ABQ8UBB2_9EUKA|nr:hypothetical protein PAPYR_10557 [Paratrimastix pyriformis]
MNPEMMRAALMMPSPSTVVAIPMRQECTPRFDDQFPIELRGLFEEREFQNMIQSFNDVIVAAWPNISCFVVSSVFCICTCGIPMFMGIHQFVKARKLLGMAVRRKSDELSSRGIQLRLRDANTPNHYNSNAPTWIEISASEEARARQCATVMAAKGLTVVPTGMVAPGFQAQPVMDVSVAVAAPPMGMPMPMPMMGTQAPQLPMATFEPLPKEPSAPSYNPAVLMPTYTPPQTL